MSPDRPSPICCQNGRNGRKNVYKLRTIAGVDRVLIDGHLAIGGSANYTKAAEGRNAENVTFTESAEFAAWFLENWVSRRMASERYTPPD